MASEATPLILSITSDTALYSLQKEKKNKYNPQTSNFLPAA